MTSKECPKCLYVRQPSDNVVPDWQCPKCGVVYAKVKTPLNKSVKVRLASGQEIEFNKIKLFDLTLIRKAENLRQSAAKNFAGHSTGLGFFGDLEWVALGSVVTGIIDSSVSGQMAKQGAVQMTEIAALSHRIRETAAYVPVSSIENIKYPDIGMWRAVETSSIKRREMCHIASDYVFVEIDDREVALFWNKIERYEYIEKS